MSRHPDDDMRNRLAAYALGAMEPDEHATFERELDAHLAEGCPECEAALAEYSDAVVSLARSAPSATPSPGLRDRVLGAVEEAAQGDPRTPLAAPSRRRGLHPAYGWAAAVVVGILGLLGWQRAFETEGDLRRAEDRARDLERENDDLGATVTELEAELQDVRLNREILTAAAVEIVPLAPTDDAVPAPGARIAYDPAAGSAVALFHDAAPPPGKDFQLWALRDGAVTNLGVLVVDAGGTLELRLDLGDTPGPILGFAVSLEDAGGSPDPTAPTGPVVAVGLRG